MCSENILEWLLFCVKEIFFQKLCQCQLDNAKILKGKEKKKCHVYQCFHLKISIEKGPSGNYVFQIRVRATDAGTPPRSVVSTVTVTIRKETSNLTIPDYSFPVQETRQVQDIIETLVATPSVRRLCYCSLQLDTWFVTRLFLSISLLKWVWVFFRIL